MTRAVANAISPPQVFLRLRRRFEDLSVAGVFTDESYDGDPAFPSLSCPADQKYLKQCQSSVSTVCGSVDITPRTIKCSLSFDQF